MKLIDVLNKILQKLEEIRCAIIDVESELEKLNRSKNETN
jgi:hypothetical protein